MRLDEGGPGSTLERRAPGILHAVRESIMEVVGPSLVGLYVYGSLVAGGFEAEISDIDLITVLEDDPSDELASKLEAMHGALAEQHPNWAGRIEVVYVGVARLRSLSEEIPRMAVISPGEPFHVVRAGREWLLTWYPAREEGVALSGPPITTVIPEISQRDFCGSVRGRLKEFRGGPEDGASRGSCAYTVFTVCRGLYTLEFGSRPSKGRAAEWVAEQFPEWAGLIDSARTWRTQRWVLQGPDPSAVAETRRFVQVMTEGGGH